MCMNPDSKIDDVSAQQFLQTINKFSNGAY